MTLNKQLGILISLLIIIMIGSVMLNNFNSAKKDMIQNLYETTVNNISTLTAKLADASEDQAILVSTIDAEFDSGYYRVIEFKSNDGLSDYSKIDEDHTAGVPEWFIKFTNVELESVSADVSSGWDMIGVVSVQEDKGIVYKALYKMFINLSYIFVVSVVVAQLILTILLHYVLKPLYRIQNQAEAITHNQFVIQEKIPFTTEFKDVVNGMNTMVKKVEKMFNESTENYNKSQELLYDDPTTKLKNRRYMMLNLLNLIQRENKTNGGTAIIVALSGAELLNKALGRQKADELFLEFGKLLKTTASAFEDRLIARVNGTEFAVVISDCPINEGTKIAATINEKFVALLLSNKVDNKDVYINMGLYQYKTSTTIGDLLTKADNALTVSKSKHDENISTYEEKADENALGKEQWRSIIEDSISNNLFKLTFWPTLNVKTKKIDHKVMTFGIDDGVSKKYFYGDFIAPAINLGLVSEMYLSTLKDLLINRHPELDGNTCSIRLSNEFIKDPSSYTALAKLFKKHESSIQFNLSFELTDSFVVNNVAAVKSFVDLFAKYGFEFGINSYTGESKDHTYLQHLNLKFVKVDAAFLLDLSAESISALQIITGSLGIDIIATSVMNQEELDKLVSMNIYAIQGPATDLIKID